MDDIERVLCRQVSRWRGRAGRGVHGALGGHGARGEDDIPEDQGDTLDPVDTSFTEGLFQ